MQNKTLSAQPTKIERSWFVVSAEGQSLGRLASQVAAVLRGKHRPDFTPHVDCGDHVIVLNAEAVELTGNKRVEKMRYSHSGYPGHLRAKSYGDLLDSEPEEVIRRAVRGMLPHTPLGRKMLSKLKVYRGSEHPHEAQQPEPLPVE